ncbi:hypothetical protein [Novipirellula sp.]|uniref:hypothetical protein n=1 Tax=Novipirellula sp. TaxID=2795430 RepID=UPI00356A32AA
MKRIISKPCVFAALLSVMSVAAMTGCSEQSNSVTGGSKDELNAYLEEHPELVEGANQYEKQWEDGYVEPDAEEE